MQILDGQQIKSVTAEGLTYIDNDGTEKFIDFSECFENYKNRRLSPEYWERFKELNHLSDTDWNQHVKSIENWKHVGYRNLDELYIDFETNPCLRFTFTTVNEFQRIRHTIRKLRWQTSDLT